MEVKNFKNWAFKSVEHIKNPERYLLHSKQILDRYNIKWYVGFGTALGFYRDKDFIPQDTDIDIEIITDENTPVNDIIEQFSNHYAYIRSVNHNGQQQSAFQTEDGFIIDLSFFRKEGNNLITRHEEGTYIDSLDIIGDIKMLDTKYCKLPIPEKIEDYLVARYGDWKTPKYGASTSSIRN